MSVIRIRRPLAFAALVALSVVAACSGAKPASPPPASQALWGDMKSVVSVKELMRDLIDPLADNIFDAVRSDVTSKGTTESRPTTDDDWEKVRIGATALAEGSYLLKVPRPFAPAGDTNNSGPPDYWELSPAEIKAKLDADPVLWNAKIEALRNVGLEVLEIVKKKDADALFDAAGDLDIACETCHLEYWYPSEKALMPRLDRQLRELFPSSAKKPVASHTPGGARP
jgi:cytochrome c556